MQLLKPIALLPLTSAMEAVARQKKKCDLGEDVTTWYLCYKPSDLDDKHIDKLEGEARKKNHHGGKYQCGGKILYLRLLLRCGKIGGDTDSDSNPSAGSMVPGERKNLEDACADFQKLTTT
ncbi:hypothetical protein H4Q26_013309 [Puccinia striiformis f. sp. tritici PST-130]|nr:hypothetical protein H4Q26_013309 [Puccinia striiformis f. sp. tritici PST-130]